MWIGRFVHIWRNNLKLLRPIKTEEIEHARIWWNKRIQESHRKEDNYTKVKAELGLQLNEHNIEICHGRIQGKYPIYLPRNAMFSKKLVKECITTHSTGELG